MMKKIAMATVAMGMAAVAGAQAQEKGTFDVRDLGEFKLHVYMTNDALGDASYIVEGEGGLVTLEQPLFKDNVAEFDRYLTRLGKPVVKRIADYHVGGTGSEPYVMPEGMPAFVKGDIYGGMMAGFAQAFGDAIVSMPTGDVSETAFGSRQTWAGVEFSFGRGAASDFPGAAIMIGGKVRHTHWAPTRSHVSPLQVSSAAALDAEIADLNAALQSGATLHTGSHGGVATKADAEQRLAYLQRAKALMANNVSADKFVAEMKAAYPGMPGEENLAGLAKALGAK